MEWPTFTEWVQIAVAIASGAVAIATLVLAHRTGAMATETKKVAQATESEAKAVAEQSEKVAVQAAATDEQARVSAEALRASIRPWLTRTETTTRPYVTPDDWTAGGYRDVQLHVRNVGTGIALISPESCRIRGRGASEGVFTERIGAVDQPALPPKESALIRFHIEGPDFSLEDFFNRRKTWGSFNVSVTYTDVDGEQEVVADIQVTALDQEGTRWRLHRIAYTRATEDEPFASVEFDARFDSSTD